MQQFKFEKAKTGLFGAQHVRMSNDQYSLLPFINRVFSEENIIRQTKDKKGVDRNLLVKALTRQYSNALVDEKTKANIEALSQDHVFTLTTGHQLSLLSGPLFFVVKILQVIRLSEELNEKYSDLHFVPVYWMASEDHDFEEIQKIQIFHKELVWESEQGGAVGRFKLDDDFKRIKAEFAELFRDEHLEIHDLINALDGKNYADAMRNFVSKFFSDSGLVIVDGDDPELKRFFASIMQRELETSFSYDAVQKTNVKLQKEGLKIQLNARDINLFYLTANQRIGIERDGDGYKLGNEGFISREDILNDLEKNPEKFSPGAVLRPVYQEFILPNVLYLGGGGEIAYWLQLKGVFDSLNLLYPLIQVRNSVMWIESLVEKKIAKLELPLEMLFHSEQELKQWVLARNAAEELDDSALLESLEEFKEVLSKFVVGVDSGLEKYANAEATKIENQVNGIRSKMVRTAKQQHDDAMKSVEFIVKRLYPEGKLQERMVNFFQFCADGNLKENLEQLKRSMNPFESEFIVLREN